MVAFKIIGVKSVALVAILLEAALSTLASIVTLLGVKVSSIPVGGTVTELSVIKAVSPYLYFSVPAALAAMAQFVT